VSTLPSGGAIREEEEDDSSTPSASAAANATTANTSGGSVSLNINGQLREVSIPNSVHSSPTSRRGRGDDTKL